MQKIVSLFLTIFVFLFIPASSFAASLSLSPASGTLNRGCSYSIDINLNTDGKNTDGTDAIVKYDPSKITVTSITPGTIYPDYPTANPNNSTGTVAISGLASVSTPVSGSGKFATLNINVASSATAGVATQMNFVYDPNNPTDTTDSNVVESATVVDILNSVTNGNFTVGGGTCAGGTLTTPQGASSVQNKGATPSAETIDVITGGPSGITDNTIILSVVGGILTVLGILGLALL